MKKKEGYSIVFTSSSTEMNDFKEDPFIAFTAGFPKFYSMWNGFPRINFDERGAKYAPYGMRKIQATLMENGFSEDDMITTHPKYLKRFVGPNTKIIAISAMDPLALAYVDLTYSAFLGMGEPNNAIEFRKMLLKQKCLKKYHPTIVLGGAGAWQIANKRAMDYLGVDHVILGECEEIIIDVFSKLIQNEQIPPIIQSNSLNEESIVPIKHPVIHGCVEISRGCGRNCQFCSPTMRKRRDIPLKQILKEVDVNIKGGNRMITLITEDLLLYKCKSKRFIPNEKAVCELCESIAAKKRIQFIQPTHISLAAVCAAPNLIPKLTEIFWDHSINEIKGRYRIHGKQIMSAETGIETGSPRILAKYMRGKCMPFTPKEWPEIVIQALGILNDNDWLPLASFLLDVPGETEDDTLKTIELIDDLKSYDLFLMPILFVPLRDSVLKNERKADWNAISNASREVFMRCWENNSETYKEDYLVGFKKQFLRFLAGSLYLSYYRWKNSKIDYKRIICKVAGLNA